MRQFNGEVRESRALRGHYRTMTRAFGWTLGGRGAVDATGVKASSSLMGEANLVWPDVAHRGPIPDRDGCLSSPAMASLMNGLHCQEEKGKKGAWEPSEDQYIRPGEPPSHAKNPRRAPAPPGCLLCCLLHQRDKPLRVRSWRTWSEGLRGVDGYSRRTLSYEKRP